MKSFFNVVIYSDFEITEDNVSQALNNGLHCSENSHFKILVSKQDKSTIECLQEQCEMQGKVIGQLIEDKL